VKLLLLVVLVVLPGQGKQAPGRRSFCMGPASAHRLHKQPVSCSMPKPYRDTYNLHCSISPPSSRERVLLTGPACCSPCASRHGPKWVC
jgi:hypothetical protein